MCAPLPRPPPASGQLQHSKMALGIGRNAGTASPRPCDAADEVSRVRRRQTPLLHSLALCGSCSTATTIPPSECSGAEQYRLAAVWVKILSSCGGGGGGGVPYLKRHARLQLRQLASSHRETQPTQLRLGCGMWAFPRQKGPEHRAVKHTTDRIGGQARLR